MYGVRTKRHVRIDDQNKILGIVTFYNKYTTYIWDIQLVGTQKEKLPRKIVQHFQLTTPKSNRPTR